MIIAIAGQHSYHGVTIEDVSPIATGFPTFEAIIDNLKVQN